MRNTILLVFLALTLILVPVSAMAGDTCQMNMEIANALFSVVGDNGAPVRLSDIGCAVPMRNEMCAMEQIGFDNTAVVKDFYTGREKPMSIAYFVMHSGVATPLGSAVIAFGDRESAERFVSENGKGEVLDYSDFMASEVLFAEGADKDMETPSEDTK